MLLLLLLSLLSNPLPPRDLTEGEVEDLGDPPSFEEDEESFLESKELSLKGMVWFPFLEEWVCLSTGGC